MIQKRILVTALYVSGTDVAEGGSSRFMRCVADALIDLGHQVVLTNKPENFCYEPFDLIVCSHKEKYDIIRPNPAPKLFISHGTIPDEAPPPDAEVCISVSEEVQKHNRLLGVNSRVIGQPVKLRWNSVADEHLQKILVIRRYPVEEDPFRFLSEKYDLRYSNMTLPIEPQIDWSDLCITLGRGALEAMAQGRTVLVADNRGYIGPVGDGYVTEENIREIAKNNFSGRRFRYPLMRGWIESELAKYNRKDAADLFTYVTENHRAGLIVKEYLNYAR